ncbi:hypothetical protein FE633_30880 [Streptomyces montanus]|uniref:Uncharacterized protein n=1 Tax=Streptomyces montanus TaxID=2580423 RepID=A0A5R9FGT4_9ACTN|nr:hypothetical protein [Streptomyces montanus]TLS42391.1 hypothetical protein FE633_30880 [Streptomyces montanus]
MWDDDHLRKEAERQRISSGEHYRDAAKADKLGRATEARRSREMAEHATRKAELYERLIGRWQFGGGKLELISIDLDEAHKLLDRFDSNPAREVLTHAEHSPLAEGRLEIIQGKACSWAFGNAVRNGAIEEIIRMVDLIESEGAEVNVAALARMTGISRQTLHARLRASR